MLSKPMNHFTIIRLPASQTGYYWDLPCIYDSWPTPKVNHRLSLHKKASEYHQIIPQSHTAESPTRKSHIKNTRRQADKQSKATSPLFPIKMIAKLKRTQSNV